MADSKTMQAVIFKGKFQVAVEQRPLPQIQDPRDILVKVRYTALCGSDLHMYRGKEGVGSDFILGHEITGEVIEVGSNVKNFVNGDLIVSPFTTSCGTCFYCSNEFSSRCEISQIFGFGGLEGGQAEYCRIPLADTTAVRAPKHIDERMLVLMADVLPTGYFAAKNAFVGFPDKVISQSTVVLIGCGPVGLCALVNALEYKPKHLLAVDAIPDRLERARNLGAEPWNYQTDMVGLENRVMELTNGRGADAVIEVVGHPAALKTGFKLLRYFGNLSSVGVHTSDLPLSPQDIYERSLRLQMGRCPVRSLFEQSLEVLAKYQSQLDFMIDNIRPLSDAVKAYDDFHMMKYQKIIFEANK